MGISNIYSLVNKWQLLDLGGIFSSIFGIVFNFALVLFFNHLRLSAPQIPQEDMPTEEELNKFMEGLK